MYPAFRPFVLVLLCAAAGALTRASAQAIPTASWAIAPSAFVGTTGVSTGLDSGTNLSITAGIDVAFRTGRTIQPELEYRGMDALHKGSVDSLKSNLGGLKLSGSYRRTRPYIDILVGRGETTYANGGFQVPNKVIFYTQSSSNVFSFGGGTDIPAATKFSLKLDFQIQRYSSPVSASGHLYSEAGTIGLVYIFHIGRKAM